MPCWLLAEGLCFAHTHDRPLIDNLSLSVADEIVALVGGNGIGKSTLLALLTGSLTPSRGHIVRRGRHFLWPQVPEPGQHVRDLLPTDDAGRAGALSRMGLPPRLTADTPLTQLSGGQIARLRLAAIDLLRPDLLVLDEPGNDLDTEGRQLLADLIGRWRKGMLLVSHEPALLSRADRILDLSPLGLRNHGGGYKGWLDVRAAERLAAERALSAADKQARHVRDTAHEAEARAARRARTGRQAAERGSNAPILLGTRRDNAERAGAARRTQVERQTAQAEAAQAEARSRLAPPLPPLDMAIGRTGVPAGRVLLRVEGLRLSLGGRSLWQDLSFDLTGPTRLALSGPNEAGKSSLLDCLDGRLVPDGGRIVKAPGLFLARLDQRLAAGSDETPLSLVRSSQPGQDEQAIRAALARFGFRAAAATVPLRLLSGGMRVRAHLCACLGGVRPPHLLLLDEPSNHLDLDGRAALLEAVRAYDGALILVSHDPEFRRAVGMTEELCLG